MRDKRLSLVCGNDTVLTLYDMELETGTQFRIKSEQGRGNSCIVYRAFLLENGKEDRPVLLKEFYPVEFCGLLTRNSQNHGLQCDETSVPPGMLSMYKYQRKRFKAACDKQKKFYRQTADAAADENVEIQGMYQLGESWYSMMSVGSGLSWDQIEIKKESLHDILETVISVLDDLKVYHSNDLLHCDVKPANIYIFRKTRQHVRLLDFDSVQKLQDGQLTGKENLSYSPAYAAPELLDIASINENNTDRADYFSLITPKSDLYSTGAVLYERLTGQRIKPNMSAVDLDKFLSVSLETLWEKEKNAWLQNIKHSVILELKHFLKKCLAREPDDRCGLETLQEWIKRILIFAKPQELKLRAECRVSEACPGFVGRKNELNRLKSMLEGKEHTIFISGQGGLGKSELTLRLAQELKGDFDFYKVTFCEDLEQTILSLPVEPMPVANVEQEATKLQKEELYLWNLRCLRGYSSTNVLIIDNFDTNPENMNKVLHSRAYADLSSLDMKLIFTSREHPDFHAICLKLGELTRDELTTLFRNYYKGSYDEDALNELIKRAGYNTLVIELAAKNLEQSWGRLRLESLLEVFSAPNEKNAEFAIYNHIRRLFDVTQLSEGSKELMAQTSIFPTGGITASLCLLCHSETEQDKLRLLELNGWLRKTQGNFLTVHPLIQKVCQNELPQRDEACRKFLNSYGLLYLTLPNKLRLENQFQYVDMCSNAADLLPDPSGEYAAQAGDLNYHVGRYFKALLYNQKLWDIYIQLPNIDSSRAISIIDRVAACHLGLGQYEEAAYMEVQGIETYERLESKDDPILADYYNNLGTIYKEGGRYEKAIECYQHAETFYGKSGMETNMGKASLYLNLCKLNEKCGKYDVSKEYGQKALAYYEQFDEKYIPIAVSRASVYTTLGILSEHDKDFENALRYYDKAIEIYEASYGHNNPWTAGSYNDKGIVLTYLERYDEALSYLERALKIKEEIYGPFHTSVANTLHSLADMYRLKKEYGKALELCKRAENIRINAFGPENLLLAKSYGLHSYILYEAKENLNEALHYGYLECKIYQKATESSIYAGPDFEYAKQRLYQIYAAIGNPPETFE